MIPGHPSLRKKILVPLLLVLIAVLTAVAVENTVSFKGRLTTRLQQRAARIANTIRFIAGSAQKPEELQHLVSVMGGESGINLIVVVAGAPARVVASSRMAMLGQSPDHFRDHEWNRKLDDDALTAGDFRFDKMGDEFDYFHPLSVAAQGSEGLQLLRGHVMVSLDTGPLRREVLELTAKTIAGYFVAVLALGISCWVLLTRHILRPLEQIGAAVAGFRGGDATRIADATVSSDEFSGLTGAWNGLIDRLAREEEERTRAEAVLQRQQTELRVLFDLIPAMIWFKDTENGILRINKRVADAAGKTVAEIEGRPSHEIYPQEAARFHADDLEVIRGGVPKLGYVEMLPGPDGRKLWVQTDKVPYCDGDGKVIGIVVVAKDVTESRRAEEELRWKTAFLEAQVSSSPDGIIVVDQQGRKILQNRRTAELFKIPRHIVDDKDDKTQLQWVTDMTRNPEVFFERVAHLNAHPDEIGRDEIELKDGTVLDRYSSPVIGKDGKYYGRTWAFRDITERRRTRTALIESKRFLQSTLDALSSHIAILDEHGTIVEVNAAWDRFASQNGMNGSHRSVGDNYLQLCDASTGRHSEEASVVAAGIRAVMAGQRDEFDLEYPCHGPREKRWFVVRVTRFAGDGPVRAVVAHENISERKRTAVALQESELRYRSLFENMVEGYARCRLILEPDQLPDLVYLEVNDAFGALTGLKDVVGEKFSEVIPGHRESNPEVIETYRRVVLTGKPERFETHLEALGIWLSITVYRHKKDEFVAVFDNITERKRADDALRSSQKRLRDLIDGLGTSMFVGLMTPEGIMIECNQSSLAAAGLKPEDVLGKSFEETYWWAYSPEVQQQLRETIARAACGEASRYDVQIRVADNQFVDVDFSVQPVRDDTGKVVLLVPSGSVITERKQAEAARGRLAAILESTTDLVSIADPAGNLVYLNRAGRILLGVDAQEDITKKAIADFLPDAANHPNVTEGIPTAVSKGTWSGETVFLNRAGQQFPVSQVILAQRTSAGDLEFLSTIARDITERKHAEAALEKAHRELMDASRQAGMAEVATNVLHNVGNVLNSVNVSATLVAEGVKKSNVGDLARVVALLDQHAADLGDFVSRNPQGRNLPAFLRQLSEHLIRERQNAITELASLRENIEHIKDIVAMQQSYAKVSGLTEILKVTDLVEDSLRMNAGALTRHEVKVVREYQKVPPISVEKHKVLQILVNLIRNAKYACDDAGVPDKRMTLRVLNSGGTVEISVIDNGVGVPPENLTRIFNHGFTTRKEGHGFGLHSSALAAKEMGGALRVESEGPGRGTTFTLELPATPFNSKPA
jgi:PAS domain S-box-containing protein